MLLASEHEGYAWLNDVVCVGEGSIDASTTTSRIEVFVRVPGA